MKHLKYFEVTIEDAPTQPQIGDYVVCEENNTDDILVNFIANNIGKIIDSVKYTDDIRYYITYQNIPEILKLDFNHNNMDNCRYMAIEEIKFFSPDKEKLKQIILNNKYNL
jgi:hypothetical protein